MKNDTFLRIILLTNLFCEPIIAQVIPDTTLPNNSNVDSLNNTTTVTGGTQVGNNLFHSFEKFSIPTNATVYFNNPNVQNIFSRVTGKSISNIDGRIQVNGNANVFLMNPNGIIFGPNASLSIGGSFFATTANSINFADGTQFSAVTPQNVPLLKINVPIGLQIGSNSGKIIVKNVGHRLTVEDPISSPLINSVKSSGLQVQSGKNIALVGGDVNLEGGVIIAPGGKVEIGSVNQGLVRFNLNNSIWNFDYSDVTAFKDINLSQSALINTSDFGGGYINVQSDRLTLIDGSLFLNQSLGSVPSGTLNINTSNSIKLSGTNSGTRIPSGFLSQIVGDGVGGDVTVETKHLVVQDGAEIVNLTLGNAPTGDIFINASDSVQVSGFSSQDPELISTINTGSRGPGNAGNVTIKTRDLFAERGGVIASLTASSGAAGNLYIEATDSVKLVGTNKYLSLSSGLTSSTKDVGNSGNVIVNTSNLLLQSGGTISASTTSIGKAGDIFINASQFIEVSGIADPNIPSLIISSAQKLDEVLENVYNITTEPSGKSGNVNINTPQLRVIDGGLISVRNDGQNDAGTLRIINSKSITLNNGGSITAASALGGGGNIFLKAESIQLSRGSKITTNAVNGIGNGGNINVDTSVLSILRNSSITADAVQGRGGYIQINTEGLFLSPDSKVTASSALGVDGIVQIATLETQPIPDKVFSEEVTEAPEITSTCQVSSDRKASTFVNTGTGGTPYNPDNFLPASNVGWYDRSIGSQEDKTLEEKLPTAPTQIVEAQGWQQNPDGTIVLTAEPTGPIAYSSSASHGCSQTAATESNTTVKNHILIK